MLAGATAIRQLSPLLLPCLAMPTAGILLSATIAGYFDFRWRRIPNWLVATTIAGSLIWHGVVNGRVGIGMSVSGLLLGTAVLYPLYLLRGMGAGDVKFFGALGAGVTHRHLFTILIIACVTAALMGLYQVLRRGAWRQTMANTVDLLGEFLRGRFRPHPRVHIENRRALLLPFTLSVAIATWIFFLFY